MSQTERQRLCSRVYLARRKFLDGLMDLREFDRRRGKAGRPLPISLVAVSEDQVREFSTWTPPADPEPEVIEWMVKR